MEIAVLDIETTGFNKNLDAILEIGIVLVNTNTGTITKIFDERVKDSNFDKKRHSNSWIFENSNLKIEDVVKANTLESHRNAIQDIFDKYPMTAFNMKFDVGFMECRGFKLNKTKCLMETSRKYNVNLDKFGRKKVPSVQEIYNQFYPKEKYIEEHRGCDDAYHEGKILLKLVELKKKLNESTNTKEINRK